MLASSSVVVCVLSIHKALNSISSTHKHTKKILAFVVIPRKVFANILFVLYK
jgi:hypothetical protein